METAPHPLVHRFVTGFIGINAGFVAAYSLVNPQGLDEAFTWANLPPLHARFVGALYLWGTIVLVWAALARRRAVWWPIVVGAAIFTSSMGILTALNRRAFDWSLLPVKVWVLAYIVFPLMTLPLAWRYRRSDPADAGGPDMPGNAVRILHGLTLIFGLLGVGLLVVRSAAVSAWPWPVSDGVAQFYGGPFLTIAWCCWAYSRRSVRDCRGFALAMAALGLAVVAVSIKHRVLFDAGDISTWLWFALFGTVAVAFSYAVVRSVGLVSCARRNYPSTGTSTP